MSDIAKSIFANRKFNLNKALDFGFKPQNNGYVFCTELKQSGFKMAVKICESGEASAEVTDPEFGEPYTLHLAENAVGSFVGQVKEEYEKQLANVANCCFEPDVFKQAQAKEIIEYASKKYGDELEFPWGNDNFAAILRRKDTAKWYGVIMKIPAQKLNNEFSGMAEILDFHIEPQELDAIADNKKYFRGYHMNKKHWCTAVLNGSVSTEELLKRIDKSYELAGKH